MNIRYRKKPLEVEAVCWHPNRLADVGRMMGWFYEREFSAFFIEGDKTLAIKTMEGWMRAADGDFVIRGILGEFYVCNPIVFAMTYEPVEGYVEHIARSAR